MGLKFLAIHKKLFISIIIALCAASMFITITYQVNPTFVNNTVGFIFSPVSKVFVKSSDWVSGKLHTLFNLGYIAAENERLREEAETLRIENSRLKQVDAENERLSALLEIDRKYINYPKIGASVIGKDPGNWYNMFLIDKGAKDGIEKNMVVLGAGGLVGRVFEAGYNYSKVISLIDDMSSISAKSARTEDVGFLKGDIYLMLEGKCRMEFIDADAQMMAGDEIVTSHLSDIYPAGITIGYVTEIRLDGNGTKTAIVQPNIDFKHIETVLVLTEHFERKLLDEAPEPSASPEPAE
jgi:rod shape-determining protein MreC